VEYYVIEMNLVPADLRRSACLRSNSSVRIYKLKIMNLYLWSSARIAPFHIQLFCERTFISENSPFS